MADVYLESGYVSLFKHGEQLCGDCVVMTDDEESSTIVLSDGLGSGVKANILSTLSAKILATLIDKDVPIEESVELIAKTLPVCSVRGVAYSTFTILKVYKNGDAYLVQFDNPDMILIRDHDEFIYPKIKKEICGKVIYESRFKVFEDDMMVLMSDGVIYAGVGQILNYGWQRPNVVNYCKSKYTKELSAKSMAIMIGQSCNELYADKPGDDTTIAAMRVRRRQTVNLMVGPPKDKKDDETIMQMFFSKAGKKIVCGGTTSQNTARFLNKKIVPNMGYFDPEVPPTATIEGVDIVSEGVITLSKVVKIIERYNQTKNFDILYDKKQDGASQIAKLLVEEATDVNFFVGRAVNPAHQNPDLPEEININIKMSIVSRLDQLLTEMGKKVRANYF